jgi:hypothetical protein
VNAATFTWLRLNCKRKIQKETQNNSEKPHLGEFYLIAEEQKNEMVVVLFE